MLQEVTKLNLAAITKKTTALKKQNFSRLNGVVLRNISVEPIKNYLEYLAFQIQFDLKIDFFDYDHFLQEIYAEQSRLTQQTHFVWVFLKLENLSPNLVYRFTSISRQEKDEELKQIKQFIYSIVQGVRQKSNTVVIWHGFEVPAYPSQGIRDNFIADSQVNLIHELNNFIKEFQASYKNFYFIDLNLIMLRLGMANYYDMRYWHLAKAPYTLKALSHIAFEDAKIIRAIYGHTKKCLIIDCDNTLWGGVVGEDGLTGIALSDDYPGSAYKEFQQELVNLVNKGLMLALCSKNNQTDVDAVFKTHPEMILKDEHIIERQINWDNKANNIVEIAKKLNISLEHVVFIDDSEYELELVRHILPQVACIHFNSKEPEAMREVLLASGYFDKLAETDEDFLRSKSYQGDQLRREQLTKFENIDDYLRSLNMVLTCKKMEAVDIARAAQLTQKTNQFNLTTKRYTETQLQQLMQTHRYKILLVKLKDQFSDLGTIGLGILDLDKETAVVDTFLLSCRALGRKVEDTLLMVILQFCQENGYEKLIGKYIKTAKNAQTENFFLKHGFKKKIGAKESPETQYIFDLKKNKIPEHLFSGTIIKQID